MPLHHYSEIYILSYIIDGEEEDDMVLVEHDVKKRI